jgi:hypothetical protein
MNNISAKKKMLMKNKKHNKYNSQEITHKKFKINLILIMK